MSEYVFKLPDLGEGTVESEIGEWFIKVGDRVSEEDVVGTMMTEKAAVELSSPVTGTVLKLAGEPGDIVAVGAALVVIETDADAGGPSGSNGAETVAAHRPATSGEVAPTAAATKVAANKEARIPTSPAVRRRAREAGIDLHDVPGTGPGGRVTRKDFDAFIGGGAVAAKADPSRSPPQRAITRPETKEIKVIGLRRIIAHGDRDA